MEKLWDKNTGLATVILLFIILKKKKKRFLLLLLYKMLSRMKLCWPNQPITENNEKGIISVHNTNNINKKLIREVKIY